MSTRLCFILSFFALSIAAQTEFIHKHPNCVVRITKGIEYYDHLKETFVNKSYRVKDFGDRGQLLAGDMYAKLEVSTPKTKLYRDCIVKVSLFQSSSYRPKNNDRKLYSKEVKRSLPRVTFSGTERCTRAISDAFVHIPYCKKSTMVIPKK